MTVDTAIPPQRLNVTETKKNKIDALALQVRNEQAQVAKYQAIVNALQAKLNRFEAEQVVAKTNVALGLSNKESVTKVMELIEHLNTEIANSVNLMNTANTHIKNAAKKAEILIKELIFSVELVNKLAELVVRKKASNPLISDELVTKVTAVGADANNAVALMLTALESLFNAQNTNIEGKRVLKLQSKETEHLKNEMCLNVNRYEAPDISFFENKDLGRKIITKLIFDAFAIYEAIYQHLLIATQDTKVQLSEANLMLQGATVELASLQSSLAAARAAALAA